MTVVSAQATLSNFHQAVPLAELVVWTQDLWSYPNIGGSRPGHTRAKPGYTLVPMIKMWRKLSNFSHIMKVFYVDNPPCPGSFCVLQPPMYPNTAQYVGA